jgi:hypothetical protein
LIEKWNIPACPPPAGKLKGRRHRTEGQRASEN